MAGRRSSKRVRHALDAVEEATDPLQALAAARRTREAAEALELALVVEVRRRGGTWHQIGAAYGTTKQAAQQRFRHVVVADPRPTG